jgi:xanthine/uracil permease
MRLIAILIAIFGGVLVAYAMSEPMIPSISQQWTMIGGWFYLWWTLSLCLRR